MRLSVLHEDNHLLVVVKPAGLLAQPDATGDPSLVELAKDYRKRREQKPGNVYIGLVHRLDRPVGGVMVLAKTSKAAARLASQFRTHTVIKHYWAVIEAPAHESRVPSELHRLPSGTWIDQLAKDASTNRSRVSRSPTGPGTPRSREARTDYRVLARGRAEWLLELVPRTGRAHQLRVQLASRGMPILGDLRYGSSRSIKDGMLGLLAVALEFDHPVTGQRLRFFAPPPPSWKHFPFDFAKLQAEYDVPGRES